MNNQDANVKDTVFAEKKETYWRFLFGYSICAILFWFIEFLLQYYWISNGEAGISLVRSFSFSGATLIGLALFSSSVFRWIPSTAAYWRIRRYLGVSGFIFALLHVVSAYRTVFDFDLKSIYFSFNPLINPIIFGSIAFPILMIMTMTSTDWVVEKLTYKTWKNIHRLVYIAYISVIFHFLLINPGLLVNVPGYILILVTIMAVFGQLFWFLKISKRNRFKSKGFFK